MVRIPRVAIPRIAATKLQSKWVTKRLSNILAFTYPPSAISGQAGVDRDLLTAAFSVADVRLLRLGRLLWGKGRTRRKGGLVHRLRHGSGHQAAESPVLHEDHHGDLGIIHGGEGHEPAMVLQLRVSLALPLPHDLNRKSTRLNSSHQLISYG